MLEFSIVQQVALIGVFVTSGLWARQKWQEKKRGISAVKK
jgi:DNA-binding transcriptional regulator/RsmH inhibitor MraZ